jgi:hypothetical protein
MIDWKAIATTVILGVISALATNYFTTNKDIAALQTDMTNVKTQLTELRQDLREIRQEIREFRSFRERIQAQAKDK